MKKILVLFVILFTAAACSPSVAFSSGSIEIVDPYARAVMVMAPQDGMAQTEGGGSNGAAYMTIENYRDEADRLVRIESDAASMVELHQSVTENEVTSMRPVESLEIPAGGQVQLKPGDYHVMLIGLKPDLAVGDVIRLTLFFEKAGSIQVTAEIKAP